MSDNRAASGSLLAAAGLRKPIASAPSIVSTEVQEAAVLDPAGREQETPTPPQAKVSVPHVVPKRTEPAVAAVSAEVEDAIAEQTRKLKSKMRPSYVKRASITVRVYDDINDVLREMMDEGIEMTTTVNDALYEYLAARLAIYKARRAAIGY